MSLSYVFLILIPLLVNGGIIQNAKGNTDYMKLLHEKNSFREKNIIEQMKNDNFVIDGKEFTIGLTIGWYHEGMYRDVDMISTVSKTLSPKSGEENHYFDLIEENVKHVVGDYINEHNMRQLEIYKNDLATLMMRYHDAPLSSDNYPDKNKQANSVSVSILSNRYLVEAVERPQSMILHYSDIASIHIMILNDVAESYTNDNFVSKWWKDLDEQLDHYIDYGHKLQNSVVDWRNDLVECSYDGASSSCTIWEWTGKVCYDKWTVEDKVWETSDVCTQLHGSNTCDDHCQAYQVAMNREVVIWIWEYMGKALRSWEILKIKSAEYAAKATQFYTIEERKLKTGQ